MPPCKGDTKGIKMEILVLVALFYLWPFVVCALFTIFVLPVIWVLSLPFQLIGAIYKFFTEADDDQNQNHNQNQG